MKLRPSSILAMLGLISAQSHGAAISVASELHTFAVLWDGKWCEEGKMGWFACVHNENPNWQEDYKRLIESIPDDATITVVDCHI